MTDTYRLYMVRLRGEYVRADFRNAARAHVPEGPLRLISEYLDRPRRPGLPAARRAVKRRPANQHHLGTAPQRLDDVAATADAAVEYHGATVADGVHNLGKHVYGRRRAVEGASAVIRHDHAIGAGVDGRPRLIAAQYALHNKLARPEVAELLDVFPSHRLKPFR